MMHSLIDWLGLLLIRGLARLLNLLPLTWALAIARWGGHIVSMSHKRRHVAYANLKAALGRRFEAHELQQIAARTYENIAQLGIEMFRFPSFDQSYVDKFLTIEGYEKMEQALLENRGIIFLAAHFGNWELSSVVSAIVGHPMKILVREQRHSRLNDFLTAMRETHGNEMIGKGMAVREIVKALRDNQIVGILSDQSGGPDGIFVELFGRRTTTPPGVVSIAKRTECIVLPSFIIRGKNGHHRIEINDPLIIPNTGDDERDIKMGLTNYLKTLEHYISMYPDQWLWGHKRWKYTLDKTIMVLTDKKPGHEPQSQALLNIYDRVAEKHDYSIRKVMCEVEYRSSFHRFFLQLVAPLIAPFMQGHLDLLKYFLTPVSQEKLSREYADIIVACGSSTIALAHILKFENLAKIISIMKPPFPYDRMSYNLLILPKHDRFTNTKQKTIRLRTALSRTNESFLKEQSNVLREHFPLSEKRIFSLLIGGDTKNYAFDGEWARKTIDAIVSLAEREDAQILVTTSRRTRRDVINMIKEKLSNESRCKLLVIPTEENIENVVYGMIGIAEAVFVTEDSISMISESVQAGKKIFVLQMARTGLSKKHTSFQKNLAAEKLIVPCTFGTVGKWYGLSEAPNTAAEDTDCEKLFRALEESVT